MTGAIRLPEFPNRDPAEELTVATARVHKLILPTTDTGLNGCRHVRIRHFAPVLEKTPPR